MTENSDKSLDKLLPSLEETKVLKTLKERITSKEKPLTMTTEMTEMMTFLRNFKTSVEHRFETFEKRNEEDAKRFEVFEKRQNNNSNRLESHLSTIENKMTYLKDEVNEVKEELERENKANDLRFRKMEEDLRRMKFARMKENSAIGLGRNEDKGTRGTKKSPQKQRQEKQQRNDLTDQLSRSQEENDQPLHSSWATEIKEQLANEGKKVPKKCTNMEQNCFRENLSPVKKTRNRKKTHRENKGQNWNYLWKCSHGYFILRK